MRIFDCFLFNDENLILELRLNELDRYVDFFVIIEFKYNHQNKFKGQKIDYKILEKFKNKIKYFYIEKKFKNASSWEIENEQRNNIALGLINSKKDDIIIVSDVDEIPKLKNINFDKIGNEIICFNQIHFMYKLN